MFGGVSGNQQFQPVHCLGLSETPFLLSFVLLPIKKSNCSPAELMKCIPLCNITISTIFLRSKQQATRHLGNFNPPTLFASKIQNAYDRKVVKRFKI